MKITFTKIPNLCENNSTLIPFQFRINVSWNVFSEIDLITLSEVFSMNKWIKISIDIFDNDKIIALLDRKNGDRAFRIYIRLLCLAASMNNDGVFELADGRAMSLKTVAAFARCDYPTLYKMVIQLVELSLLKKREDTGAYYIPNWNYYQNGAAFRKIKERERKQKARAKARLEEILRLEKSDDICPQKCGTSSYIDRETEEDKEKEYLLSIEGKKEKKAVAPSVVIDKEEAEEEYNKFDNDICNLGEIGRGYVTMTKLQVEDLLERMTVEMFDDYVSRLGEYLEKRGKKNNHCYKTILSWFEDDTRVARAGALDP